MCKRAFAAVSTTVCFVILHITGPLLAAPIHDPKPPLSWQELLRCETVVVAKYQNHEGNTLSLEVVHVLKGQEVQAGQVLHVSLEHWYSVETGPVGMLAGNRLDKKFWRRGDELPKLCYKQQLMNPGPLSPVQWVPDVAKPVIYFLPRAERPALERRNQVQDARWAEGWQEALEGRPMNLFFRVMQTENPELARAALQELRQTQDFATLEHLWRDFLKALVEYSRDSRRRRTEQEVLAALGDRHGHLYERAREQLALETPLAAEVASRSVEEHVALLASARAADRESAFRCLVAVGLPVPPALERAAKDASNPALQRPAQALIQLLKERVYHPSHVTRICQIVELMPRWNRERAWRDYDAFLRHGPKSFRGAAAYSLQYFYDERALNLAFELLKDPDLATSATLSIRGLLYLGPWIPEEHRPAVERLQKVGLPRVREFLARPGVTDFQRNVLKDCFLPPPEVIRLHPPG